MIPDAIFDYHDKGILDPQQINYLCERFIEDSYQEGNKYLLIITGKGNTSLKPMGAIRPVVNLTLKRSKLVKTFKVASIELGGSGAIEVWLKD